MLWIVLPRRTSQVLLAATFTILGLATIGGIYDLCQRAAVGGPVEVGVLAVLAALATCAIGAWLGLREPPPMRETVVRLPDAPEIPVGIGSPYRGAGPSEVPALPRASARNTALVVFGCMAFAAAVVPFALHRARWVETEAVLGAWWLVWAVVLTVVARRGAAVADDHAFVVRSPFARWWRKAPPTRDSRKADRRLGWAEIFVGIGDLDALVIVVFLAIILPILFVVAWLFTEFLVPALFFVAYLGTVRALRHATQYRGAASRALYHGIKWATAYVGPLALLVWILHLSFGRH